MEELEWAGLTQHSLGQTSSWVTVGSWLCRQSQGLKPENGRSQQSCEHCVHVLKAQPLICTVTMILSLCNRKMGQEPERQPNRSWYNQRVTETLLYGYWCLLGCSHFEAEAEMSFPTHTCTPTHMCIHTSHMYTHTCTPTCMHTHVHTYAHPYACAYTCVHMHICRGTHTCTNANSAKKTRSLLRS